MPWNEANAVRLARLEGKKMAIKIGNKYRKNVQIIVLEKILSIAEMKIIMKTSPLFYE